MISRSLVVGTFLLIIALPAFGESHQQAEPQPTEPPVLPDDCESLTKGTNESPIDFLSRRWGCRAVRGDAEAEVYVGVVLHLAEEYSEAAKWYRKSAEQGNSIAQYRLGELYVDGLGVGQNYSEAKKWFYKAAEQGNADAQNSLGFMYSNGEGARQNYIEAEKWFRKAAQQGDALAQHNLGALYAKGQGVPQDYVLAHMWINLAASRLEPGDALDEVVKVRDALKVLMTPEQLAEAQRLAREWEPKPQ